MLGAILGSPVVLGGYGMWFWSDWQSRQLQDPNGYMKSAVFPGPTIQGIEVSSNTSETYPQAIEKQQY